MSEWVRTDVDFGTPGAILVAGHGEFDRWLAENGCADFDLRQLLKETPALIANAVTDVVEDCRPDLAGGILVAVRFDLATASWRFLYLHRSLPLTPEGAEFVRQSLFRMPEP